MKALFMILLVISFISIAIFGVFSMHPEMQSHNDNCVAATVQGTDCPKQNNLFDFVFFHFNAFKNFLTAISSNSVFSLLIFYSFIILIGIKAFLRNSELLRFNFARNELKRLEVFNPPSRHKFFYWLLLHENSPSAS